MKHLIALSALAVALAAAPPGADAQSAPPPLPALTQQQSQDLQARIDAYRRQTDERVARGEITPDEAERLVAWREWQIARQIASAAARPQVDEDAPADYYDARPPRDVYVTPAPAYGPYYYPAPYWGPRPYAPYAYWGPSICAGGFGHHFGGRVCF
jgi:hypothetical protein